MTARAAWLALIALASAAAAQEREPQRSRRAYANPSAVIAAEVAFARLAQNKGQWTAFRETASPDAVLFAPRMVLAQQWLKDRPNPVPASRWQPHAVWSSCDGSLMIASGAWQASDGRQGWFTTVWARQEKGGYKWALTHREASAAPSDAPEMIAARVADCSGAKPPPPPSANERKRRKPPPPPFDPARREGASRDGTLRWTVTVDPAGTRHFRAEMTIDGAMQSIRDERATSAP